MKFNTHHVVDAMAKRSPNLVVSAEIASSAPYQFAVVRLNVGVAAEKLTQNPGVLTSGFGERTPARPEDPVILFKALRSPECGFATREQLERVLPEVASALDNKGAFAVPFSVTFARGQFKVFPSTNG